MGDVVNCRLFVLKILTYWIVVACCNPAIAVWISAHRAKQSAVFDHI